MVVSQSAICQARPPRSQGLVRCLGLVRLRCVKSRRGRPMVVLGRRCSGGVRGK